MNISATRPASPTMSPCGHHGCFRPDRERPFTAASVVTLVRTVALVSPNYFFLVDRPIWLANWSKIAKGVNSSAVALLMVFTRSVPLSVAVAVALLVLKLWSTYRLARLDVPVPGGCAADPPSATGRNTALAGTR